MRDNGGGLIYKFLSPAAVAAAFRNTPIDSGWLAPGVVRCGTTPKGEFAVLAVPSGVHQIELETSRGKTKRIKVPLPPLVFVGHASAYYLWAVKTASDVKAPLFHAPLPNVFNNGSI